MYLKDIKRSIKYSDNLLLNIKFIFIFLIFSFISCKLDDEPNLETNKIITSPKKIELIKKKNKLTEPKNKYLRKIKRKRSDYKKSGSYDSKISGKSKHENQNKLKKKRTTKNKYRKKNKLTESSYKVDLIKKDLYFDNLPKDFDGFKIGLLADIHIGYFESWHLKKIYNAFYKDCNKSPVDIMLFLGDLVNYHLKEINVKRKRWLMKFNKCTKYGLILSILGNHDYDSYNFMLAKTPEKDYRKRMECFQNKVLKWKLLKNAHVILKKGKSELKFLGIEHFGKCTVVKNRGDIKKTIKNLDSVYDITNGKLKKLCKIDINKEKKPFSIMLAHDPSIIKRLWYKYKMPLVFSGHTHGAKVMLDGIKNGSFSSLVCKNKYPAGLYKSKSGKKYLYVSKGVGLSGVNLFGKEIVLNDRAKKDRIPEVTIITLRKSKKIA